MWFERLKQSYGPWTFSSKYMIRIHISIYDIILLKRIDSHAFAYQHKLKLFLKLFYIFDLASDCGKDINVLISFNTNPCVFVCVCMDCFLGYRLFAIIVDIGYTIHQHSYYHFRITSQDGAKVKVTDDRINWNLWLWLLFFSLSLSFYPFTWHFWNDELFTSTTAMKNVGNARFRWWWWWDGYTCLIYFIRWTGNGKCQLVSFQFA